MARLFLSVVLTIGVACVAGYVYFSQHLEQALVEAKASEQHATARSFARSVEGSGPATRERVQALLDALGARPGTVEAILIAPDYRITAAADHRQVGLLDRNAAVVAALRDGREFEGYERHAGTGANLFEFITPVTLGDGRRYALEVTQDDAFFLREMDEMRRSMALVGGGLLLFSALLFWLCGGRSVVRTHQLAVSRSMRDGLTDLGNHRAFSDELERSVGLARRSGDALSLVLLDLDGFKHANDRHGHKHGDEVLRRTAAAIDGAGRVGDRGFRIGGDEFALLLPQTSSAGATRYAERVLAELRQANVSASIGLNELRPGVETADVLRQEADAALYEAKRRRDGAPVAFSQIRDLVSLASPEKVQAAEDLIAQGDVTMAFQPIWTVAGEQILGYEALARPAARYGFSGPAEAFDLAVQLGQVQQLDRLCIERAFARAGELPAEALLFVNVTPNTLDIRAGRGHWLAHLAAQAGVPTERIVVEVTERSTTRTTALLKALHELRADGFKLALDDAGTGNSGLELLRDVQFDFVKIDRGIVNAAQTETRARGVFFALASYAHQTGAQVIAEGIEDEQTLAFVQGAAKTALTTPVSVQAAQGYHLGRPTETIPALLPMAG
jgi:diguanylate cyclase (GGDEF)-like protein